MIYTKYNTIGMGRPVERFVDAAGNVYAQDTLYIDTVSGLMIRYKRDSNGNLVTDTGMGEVVTEILTVPAPVTVEFAGVYQRVHIVTDESLDIPPFDKIEWDTIVQKATLTRTYMQAALADEVEPDHVVHHE